MEQRVLNIELRENTGKGSCRRLRSAGRVPAVVYGKGFESVPVSVDAKEFTAAIAGEGGVNHLITLRGAGSVDGQTVIVSDLSSDCLKGSFIHVDLHKVNLQEKVKVKVPVSLKGTAKGIKEGGMLDFVKHDLELECLASQIPEHIEIDVTDLGIGGSLHVGDIAIVPGVKLLEDVKSTIVNILGKPKELESAESETE
jgi:large subunit ribosomal protein L25